METEVKDAEREYLLQGEMLFGSGRYGQAAACADKALVLNERSLRAYLLKGAACASMQDYGTAEECFKRAVMVDKKSGEAHYHMGSIHLMKGEIEQGIDEYRLAIENGYDHPEIYFNLGLAYEERENYETAVQEYTRAIRKDGLNPLYYVRKVQVYRMLGRDAEALKVLEELRRKCPNCFEGYHYAAQIYTTQGLYDRADEILRKAEEEFTEDEDILLDRLRVLVAKGDIGQALEEVQKAERMLDREDVIRQKALALNRAKLYGIQSDIETCIGQMEDALLQGRDEEMDAELHYFLMTMYRMKHEFEKMKAHADALEQYDSRNPYALGAKYFQALAGAQENETDKEKSYREAIRYYRNLALEHPQMIEIYIYRAVCHKELGELEKALDTIDYVMLLQESGKLWIIRSNILKEMGKIKEAEEALKKAEEAGEDVTIWKEM